MIDKVPSSDRGVRAAQLNRWTDGRTMDVTETLLNFRDLLIAGYSSWRRSADLSLVHDRGYLDEAFYDWAQANWELLVERPLCATGEFLEIYASGSDYEAQLYSRVFFHHATPTHEISCESQKIAVIDLLSGSEFDPRDCIFDRFVARKDSWFEEKPPFDHVLLVSGTAQYLASLSDVVFVKRPIVGAVQPGLAGGPGPRWRSEPGR